MADTQTKDERFSVKVKIKEPDMKANVQKLQEKAEFPKRGKDNAIVNDDGENNSSVRVGDGKVLMAASPDTNQKINEQQVITRSFEEQHITNRLNIKTDEIIINDHKMNPLLWEYTDYKKFTDPYTSVHSVGGFTVMGTVLIPAWDHQIHKYMLIRRLARIPMFSQDMNVPDILKELNITDPTKVAYNYNVKASTISAEDFYKQVKKQAADKKAADKKDADQKDNSSNTTPDSDNSKKDNDNKDNNNNNDNNNKTENA